MAYLRLTLDSRTRKINEDITSPNKKLDFINSSHYLIKLWQFTHLQKQNLSDIPIVAIFLHIWGYSLRDFVGEASHCIHRLHHIIFVVIIIIITVPELNYVLTNL